MRFRKAEWDVPMSEALVAYWTAWNSNDPCRVADRLAEAVTEDIEWNDPHVSFVGMGALIDHVVALRRRKPDYRFVIASAIDAHHHLLRYRWNMVRGPRTLMEGLDIATLTPDGLIARVDGFFGHPTPIGATTNGVPDDLRPGG